LDQRLNEVVMGVCEQHSCRLYDLEVISGSRGKGRSLRIYIDKPGETVGLDDCALISNSLSVLLDAEDLMPGGEYTLEVSSPGLERKLREPWHFEQVVGSKVEVTLIEPVEGDNPGINEKLTAGRLKYTGNLLSVEAGGLSVLLDEGIKITLPFVKVKRGKRLFETSKAPKKQK